MNLKRISFLVAAVLLLGACSSQTEDSSRDNADGKNTLQAASAIQTVYPFSLVTGGSRIQNYGALGSACNGTVCTAWGNRQYFQSNGDGTLTQVVRPLLYSVNNSVWTEYSPSKSFGGNLDERNPAVVTAGGCGTDGNCIAFGSRQGAVFCGDAASCPAQDGFWHADFYTSTGQSWTPGPNPINATLPNQDPNSGLYFMSASCVATTCNAVGRYFTANPRLEVPAILSISSSGTGMSVAPIALPNGQQLTNSVNQKIACSAANRCVVFGQLGSNAPYIAQSLNGSWRTAVPIALPNNAAPDTNVNIVNVSCASDGSCDAVGNYNNSGPKVFAIHIDAQGAVSQAVQIPYGSISNVSVANVADVRCPAPGACVAVGSIQYTTKCTDSAKTCMLVRGFATQQVGGTWQAITSIAQPGAKPTDALADSGKHFLTALDCSSANLCTAVGRYLKSSLTSGYNGDGASFTILNNGAWGPTTDLTLANSTKAIAGDGVNNVACGTNSVCSAFGQQDVNGTNFMTSLAITAGAVIPDQTTSTQAPVVSPTTTVGSDTVVTVPTNNAEQFTVLNPVSSPATSESSSTATKQESALAVGKSLSTTSVAAIAHLYVAKTSKVQVVVASKSKVYCQVAGSRLKALKAGKCSVSVKVTPKSGKVSSSTATITVRK